MYYGYASIWMRAKLFYGPNMMCLKAYNIIIILSVYEVQEIEFIDNFMCLCFYVFIFFQDCYRYSLSGYIYVRLMQWIIVKTMT